VRHCVLIPQLLGGAVGGPMAQELASTLGHARGEKHFVLVGTPMIKLFELQPRDAHAFPVSKDGYPHLGTNR